MKLKTFSTHTLSIVKTIESIENEFNVWAIDNKEIEIIKTHYSIQQRVNSHGTKYEELSLFVFYNNHL